MTVWVASAALPLLITWLASHVLKGLADGPALSHRHMLCTTRGILHELTRGISSECACCNDISAWSIASPSECAGYGGKVVEP